MINAGLKPNWYSFYLCVVEGYSSDKALKQMGVINSTKVGSKQRKIRDDIVPIDLEKAYKIYNTGLTIQETADQMGIKNSTLVTRFRKYGLKTRGRGGFKSRKIKEGA